MIKYEFKKFPVLATVLTILGLFCAVIAISISLISTSYDAGVPLALLEVVGTVLFLAGLTTGEVGLLKVISIIVTVCVLTASFVLAIEKYTIRDVFLFGVTLLMLINSVLVLVYYLTMNRNERIAKLYNITSIVMASLIAVYLIIYVISSIVKSEIYPQFYPIIASFGCLSIIPMVINCSLTKIEIQDEEEEDNNEQEVVDNQ